MKLIDNPEWMYSDDFEGGEDTIFWSSGAYADYGAVCSSDPDAQGKALVFNYSPDTPEADNSWSEKRFKLPLQAAQLEISFDQYVPSN